MLLGRPDCHLCHEMRAVIEEVLPAFACVLLEQDVAADPELDRRYRFEIPVLLLGSQEVARNRTSVAELAERLRDLGLRPAP